MNYGKRICLVCGTEFEAFYPAQLTCSQKCRKLREAELNRHAKMMLLARKYSDLDWLNQKLEAALARNRELERGIGEDGRVKNNQEAPKEPESAKSPGRAKKGNGAAVRTSSPQAEAKPPQKAPVPEKGKYLHVCVVCGQPFRSRFKEHRYCGDECRKAEMWSSLEGNVALDDSPF